MNDSNQVAVVPPPGVRYDPVSKKAINDDIDIALNEDERTAKIVTEIANDVLPDITKEFDV